MHRNDLWIRGLLVAVLAACSTPDDEPCAAVCGEGFTCQNQRCEVDPTATIGAEILLPEPSTVSATVNSAFSCRARAPQLRRVEMHLASGGAVLTVALDPEGNTGIYVGTGRLSEGEWTATCRVTFGPEGFERTSDSLERVFLLDRAAPTITITPIATWQSRSGTTTVTAKIIDQGGTATKKAGIDGPTVKLVAGGKTYPGTSGAGDTWTFAVSPAEITTNTIEGELEFTISAADKAGNETSETSAMNVDASGPTVAMTAPAAWIKRDAASLTVTASADSTGAGVSSVTLTGAGGTPRLSGVLEDDAFHFEITPSQWQSANAETPVPWTLVAVDEAGNEATQEGTFRIDGKGPTLTANAPTDWIGGTHYELSVAASDAASGLVESSVKWSAGGANGDCARESAGQYVCDVTLATAFGSVDPSYEVTLSAEDLLGNASQSKVALKVDRKGPTVSVESDGKWYGRGETVTVKVSASDSDAGLGGTPVFRTTAPKSSATAGSFGPNGVTFEVQAADVSLANVTTTSLSAEVEICDRVGNCTKVPANDLFKVDDQAPTITLGNDLTYLSGKGVALRRDPTGGDRAKVTFTATVADAGAGVSAQDVRLAFTGLDGSPKEIAAKSSFGGGVYAFEFDAKDAQFNAGVGNIELRVVATDAVGVNGTSAALPVATTREFWSYSPPKGAAVRGAVALSNDKAFFTLGMDDSAAHNVFSIDAATGQKAWSAKVAGTPTTPVTVGDTWMYFGSNANGGTLHAFAPWQATSEGTEAWACAGYGITRGALAYAKVAWQGTMHETVFYPSDEPNLYAFRRNAVGTDCDSKSSVVSSLNTSLSAVSHAPGVVNVGTEFGRIGRVELGTTSALFGAVSPTPSPSGLGLNIPGVPLDSLGLPFWVHPNFAKKLSATLDEPTTVPYSPKFQAATVAPASLGSDSRIYVGSNDGYLFAFDTTQVSPVFEFPVQNDVGAPKAVRTTPAIGQSGETQTLHFGANDGKFRALTTSGVELWSYTVGGNMESSPALDCNGVAYIGTETGQVIALITDSDRLADSSWPKFQHDNRNTGSLTTSNECPSPIP